MTEVALYRDPSDPSNIVLASPNGIEGSWPQASSQDFRQAVASDPDLLNDVEGDKVLHCQDGRFWLAIDWEREPIVFQLRALD
ncbi:MAG: hypothetical protein BRC58_06420 [Cyanobacteria bacterium QS_8_64_29]|nr:MAG: hypothetical protein BRC58_06420 [Cyanobacteria bacterium QS_8_64_29]